VELTPEASQRPDLASRTPAMHPDLQTALGLMFFPHKLNWFQFNR
jgi:hypothetical protein